jgi:hypothetical protein
MAGPLVFRQKAIDAQPASILAESGVQVCPVPDTSPPNQGATSIARATSHHPPAVWHPIASGASGDELSADVSGGIPGDDEATN